MRQLGNAVLWGVERKYESQRQSWMSEAVSDALNVVRMEAVK